MTRNEHDPADDRTRPLLLGYFRAHLLMTVNEMAQARSLLSAFATTEGFALGTVFIEHADSAPAAFDALIEAVQRYEARAVAVPHLRHLSVLGTPSKVRLHLERVTSARLLVASQISCMPPAQDDR